MTTELEKTPEAKPNQALIDTVRKTVFSDATDAELALFFHRCTMVGVNPLSGLIHPTKYRQKDGSSKVTFITSINLLRSKSDESGVYDGMDEPEYGPIIEQAVEGEDPIEVPEFAKVLVYRKDQSRPSIGIARWKEYYPGQLKGHQWRMRPYLMLAKCAEALARRIAFPDKLNALYTEEEMIRTTEELAGIENKTGASTRPNVNPNQVKPRSAPAATSSAAEAAPDGKVWKGVVQDVKEKPNAKGTTYFVKIGGKDYSTFKDSLGKAAMMLKGQLAEFTFKVNGQYLNLDTIAPAASEAAPEARDSDDFATDIVLFLSDNNITHDQANHWLGEYFDCNLDSMPADKQQLIEKMFREKAGVK